MKKLATWERQQHPHHDGVADEEGGMHGERHTAGMDDARMVTGESMMSCGELRMDDDSVVNRNTLNSCAHRQSCA
jgi:hypothetical protein